MEFSSPFWLVSSLSLLSSHAFLLFRFPRRVNYTMSWDVELNQITFMNEIHFGDQNLQLNDPHNRSHRHFSPEISINNRHNLAMRTLVQHVRFNPKMNWEFQLVLGALRFSFLTQIHTSSAKQIHTCQTEREEGTRSWLIRFLEHGSFV